MANICAVRTIKEGRGYTMLAEPLPHEPTLMTHDLHDMLAALDASPSPRLPAVGDAMTCNGVSNCRHCGCLYANGGENRTEDCLNAVVAARKRNA